jgi:tubulin polyglutamylase TTLL2
MSRGRGISLVSDIADVVYDAPVVVQRYIDRPLTVDGGYKFDLRIYVLVTAFQPRLEAFVSTLGFARIAAYRYQATDLSNVYAHLTNTSMSGAARKESGGKGGNVHRGPPRVDTKWTLDRLAADVNRRGTVSWEHVWTSIKNVILKTLVCVEDNIPAAPCTFELFGFDVLVDEDYTPWVLEVNASPSLEVDSREDEAVKPQLIEDIVRLLNIAPVDRHALLSAINRRLGVQDGDGGGKKSRREQVPWAEEYQSIFGKWEGRKAGDDPEDMGAFERIAPSSLHSHLHKAKRAV